MHTNNYLSCAAAFLSVLSASLAGSEPTGRIDYALAYYPPSKALVMHGGWGLVGNWMPMSEMWMLDASGWQTMDAQGSPAFSHHSMVFDESRQVLVVCGQTEMMNSSNDIWEFNGSTWTKVFSLTDTSFGDAELAYDASRQKVVLYRATFSGLVETWELESGTWQKKSPTQKPVAMFDGALFAYDAGLRKCVVVAEDVNMTKIGSETWLWDGVNWSQSTGSQPDKALMGGMAYDEARQQMVLLSTEMKTWVFDGSGWTLKSPAHSPDYLRAAFFTLKYDPTRRKCVFFGGEVTVAEGDSLSYPAKTWEWDGQDWMEFTPGTVIPVVEPTLTVERTDSKNIRISWPVDAVGFQLESAPALGTSAIWTPVAESPQGSPRAVTLPTTAGAQYFRLRKP